MFTLKHRLEMFFIIVLGTALSLFVTVQRNNHTDRRIFSAFVPTITSPTIAPTEKTTMDSPDGSKTLVLKKQQTSSMAKYSFYTSTKDAVLDNSFGTELANVQNLSIPYNTWSPDNKYIFLTESTPTLNNYYVFLASGDLIVENNEYVNIQELFSQKLPNYKITDVTGWAAPTLLVVNTVANESGNNISFWFDVESQSFIQLGTYFN